jgi:hypothetical protein
MTPRKTVSSNKSSRNLFDKVKDEVYRQMFRLEESRPGAEMGLALALLRAWLATDPKAESDENLDWLKKVSPICLQMIGTALKTAVEMIPCAKGHG